MTSAFVGRRSGLPDRLLNENAGGIFAPKRNLAGTCCSGNRATRCVSVERDTPLLLLPDRRDWVPADHLAHFVIAAVEALDRRQVQVKPRGTGDAKDPPTMRLSLLGYRYATGPFGSALGFRQFLLRGTAKVSTEGTLVCLAYNLRRLHTLGAGPKLTLAG